MHGQPLKIANKNLQQRPLTGFITIPSINYDSITSNHVPRATCFSCPGQPARRVKQLLGTQQSNVGRVRSSRQNFRLSFKLRIWPGNLVMDILKYSQLVIFSHSTVFITFSYRCLAGFPSKLLRSSRRQKPEVVLDFCVWPLCGSWDENGPAITHGNVLSPVTTARPRPLLLWRGENTILLFCSVTCDQASVWEQGLGWSWHDRDQKLVRIKN